MRKLAQLRASVDGWRVLADRLETVMELLDLAIETSDQSMLDEIRIESGSLIQEATNRELELVLSGDHDQHNDILAVHAGAGGTESQDWAQMLLRMYIRWAETRKFAPRVLDISPGEEAGIKSATIELTGAHAYGYAKAERGVHRLVRISPFDASHSRHTSFALVEVLPEADEAIDISINPDDLTIDVFKASGAGGQHVQKNSTAVRITHTPSGIVVSCQNERSQLQNKEYAMRVLRARLMAREVARREEERAKLKGEHIAAGWGNQVRSYVLHPYRMVKDHRTDFESTAPEDVLDGDLDPLIRAYLLSSVGGEGFA
jgi:peptide chain release factor 2